MIKLGIFEQIITETLSDQIAELSTEHEIQKRKLSTAELSDRLALHLGQLVIRALNDIPEAARVELGINLARSLVELIDQQVERNTFLEDRPSDTAELLTGIFEFNPDGSVLIKGSPQIPLLDTTLLTNAPGEPRIEAQLLSEIESADQIDIIMAFIRKSGIRRFTGRLKQHCESGRELRILTTTYTGSTELAALELLSDLGPKVRVSYDVSSTRLHAKAWLFNRLSGFSTSYVGSSNLTHSAQVSGLEWNLRVSGVRNPDALRKMQSMFDAYWESGDFREFETSEFKELTEPKAQGPKIYLSPVGIRLEPFQERLLEQIELARSRGRHRNLLVSATGTGKTVMAAIDYTRLKNKMARCRLLFVAHRKEILEQSMATFRHALREYSFGEYWVAGKRPEQFDHVFASVQSLNAQGLEQLEPDHFDVIIVDEFHHAAAKSYAALLSQLKPKELLGLTATPERSDGLPILDWFDQGITAELRLWDAIDQQRLVPFEYFGISDDTDLKDVPWRRGGGYDISSLENVYTGNDVRARLVIKEIVDRVSNLEELRGLGFCVSVKHAEFMADHFNRSKLSAEFVSGQTSEVDRQSSLDRLRRGDIKVLFSVDLFNEGLDMPLVNTLLFLRPTDSPVLFIQQLGRGLRKEESKNSCLVLDFVGQHRKEFRFDRRLGALLRGTRRNIEKQVEDGFPYLPAGCHMELDRVARDVVLKSLKESLPSRWREKVEELRRFVTSEKPLSLSGFLEETGMTLSDIYTGSGDNQGWSNMMEAVGLTLEASGPKEKVLRRALGRLLHIDDEPRIDFYREHFKNSQIMVDDLDTRQQRMLKMLLSMLFDSVNENFSLQEGADLLRQHKQVQSELSELFTILNDQAEHLQHELRTHQGVPLQIHSRYTRKEIVAGFGVGDTLVTRSQTWREGALWHAQEQVDVFAFTLDKSTGGFSPTTRYRDYAINRELIHWESQSRTRADSATGLRYQQHLEEGSSIMLFARESTADRAFWFLGPAIYVSHQSERPMEITWKLDVPLPGDLFSLFAAAVA